MSRFVPKAEAGRFRAYHRERRKLLAKAMLSIMTLLLTIIRMVELGADGDVGGVNVPLLVGGLTLALIWWGEKWMDEEQENAILSAAILLQAVLYWERFGPMVTLFLAGASLSYVWWGWFQANNTLKRQVGEAVSAPHMVHSTLGGVRGLKGSIRKARKKAKSLIRQR